MYKALIFLVIFHWLKICQVKFSSRFLFQSSPKLNISIRISSKFNDVLILGYIEMIQGLMLGFTSMKVKLKVIERIAMPSFIDGWKLLLRVCVKFLFHLEKQLIKTKLPKSFQLHLLPKTLQSHTFTPLDILLLRATFRFQRKPIIVWNNNNIIWLQLLLVLTNFRFCFLLIQNLIEGFNF